VRHKKNLKMKNLLLIFLAISTIACNSLEKDNTKVDKNKVTLNKNDKGLYSHSTWKREYIRLLNLSEEPIERIDKVSREYILEIDTVNGRYISEFVAPDLTIKKGLFIGGKEVLDPIYDNISQGTFVRPNCDNVYVLSKNGVKSVYLLGHGIIIENIGNDVRVEVGIKCRYISLIEIGKKDGYTRGIYLINSKKYYEVSRSSYLHIDSEETDKDLNNYLEIKNQWFHLDDAGELHLMQLPIDGHIKPLNKNLFKIYTNDDIYLFSRENNSIIQKINRSYTIQKKNDSYIAHNRHNLHIIDPSNEVSSYNYKNYKIHSVLSDKRLLVRKSDNHFLLIDLLDNVIIDFNGLSLSYIGSHYSSNDDDRRLIFESEELEITYDHQDGEILEMRRR